MHRDFDKLSVALARYQTYTIAGLAFILTFAVTVMGLLLWEATRIGANGQNLRMLAVQNHDTFCALRANEQRLHDASVKYLKDNPQGLVIGDQVIVAPGDIRKDIAQRQSTLNAFDRGGLQCEPGA